MKVYKITDKEFRDYGRMLDGYDYGELFKILKTTEIPEKEIFYTASDARLEETAVAEEMRERGFGGYPIQIGYVNGKNRVMNCLEYHKSSEYNIAMDDVILILGKVQDISCTKYDSSLCKAFFVPGGVGIELYATTLHYAPFNVSANGYRVICVLPDGTNMPRRNITKKSGEDEMYFGINKWLMAHKDAPEVKDGAHIGITNENIRFEFLEV